MASARCRCRAVTSLRGGTCLVCRGRSSRTLFRLPSTSPPSPSASKCLDWNLKHQVFSIVPFRFRRCPYSEAALRRALFERVKSVSDLPPGYIVHLPELRQDCAGVFEHSKAEVEKRVGDGVKIVPSSACAFRESVQLTFVIVKLFPISFQLFVDCCTRTRTELK